MPRKAFRGIDDDDDEGAQAHIRRGHFKLPRKAFRGLSEDDEHDVLLDAITKLPSKVCLLFDMYLAVQLAGLLGPISFTELPPDFVAEGIYLLVTTAIACAIDMQALSGMFLTSSVRALNVAAGLGVILSVLKLSIINKVSDYDHVRLPTMSLAYDLASGKLQLNPLVRSGSEWCVESVFGSVCCSYLASVFSMSVLYNGKFSLDRVGKKLLLYSVSAIALGMFSGIFATQSSFGWLLVLHAVLVAWSVMQCKRG